MTKNLEYTKFFLIAIIMCIFKQEVHAQLQYSRNIDASKFYNIILMAGQSNMEGIGKVSELEDQKLPDNIIYFNYGMSPNFKQNPNCFGPEVGLSHVLAEQFPNENFILIKYAIGGSSQFDWAPDYDPVKAKITGFPQFGNMFAKFQDKIDSVTALVNQKTVALLWMQGERDAHVPESGVHYFENFGNLIQAFRERSGTLNLPVIFGEINPPGYEFSALDTVRRSQLKIATEVPNTYLIETDDLSKFDDQIHYDTKGQLLLGKRMGEKLVDVLNETAKYPIQYGDFINIYDQGFDEDNPWYINDHCFIKDQNGKWHLFGITHEEPMNPLNERHFAHATANSLLQQSWEKMPFGLSYAPESPWNEKLLWAPFVQYHEGIYYMYYCAGGDSSTTYRIHLATSKDLENWTRHLDNPMVTDGFDGRDPMVFKDGNQWIMYYTANRPAAKGNHVVIAVTSDDLIHWNDPKVVFTHPDVGTFGGPTESPFVVKRKNKYYLFVCTNEPYDNTAAYESDSPFHWDINDRVADIPAHCAEVIQTEDGRWFVSRAGWARGGVYLAPLFWNDND